MSYAGLVLFLGKRCVLWECKLANLAFKGKTGTKRELKQEEFISFVVADGHGNITDT